MPANTRYLHLLPIRKLKDPAFAAAGTKALSRKGVVRKLQISVGTSKPSQTSNRQLDHQSGSMRCAVTKDVVC